MTENPPPINPQQHESKFRRLFSYLALRRPQSQFQQIVTLTTSLVGLFGGAVSVFLYFEEQHALQEKSKDIRAYKAIDHLSQRMERYNVTYALHQIHLYKQKVEKEIDEYERYRNRTAWRQLVSSMFHGHRASFAHIEPGDTWAQVWVKRRNAGDEAARAIEFQRVSTKATMYMLKSSYDRNPERQNLFRELMYDEPLNQRYIQRFIELVEPLDVARCETHPECDWSRDEPVIYSFLRDVYHLPRFRF